MYDLSWPGRVWELDLSYGNHFTPNQWFLMKNKAVQTIGWKWLLRVRDLVISLPLSKKWRDPRSGIKGARSEKALSLSRDESTMKSQRKRGNFTPHSTHSAALPPRLHSPIVIDATLVPGCGPVETVKWWLWKWNKIHFFPLLTTVRD